MAKSRNQVLRRLKLQAEPKAAARLIPAPREDPEATSSTAVLLEQDTAAVPVDEPTEELPEDQGEEAPAEDENTADPEDQADAENTADPEDQAEDDQPHDDPAEDENTADPEDPAPEDQADQVLLIQADSADPEEYDQGRTYAAAYALATAAARATREGRSYGDTDAYAEVEAVADRGDIAPVAAADQPPDPAPARTRRMGPAALVLAGVAALVVALLALLPLRGSDPSNPTGTGPREDGSAAQFAALPPNGSFTRTRVLASGDLRVDHWIRSRVQLSSLSLAVPRVPGLDPGSVSADDVTVVAGGGRARGAASVGTAAETYRFAGTKQVHLSYVLTGVVRRSSSTTGRALARVTGLDVRYTPQRGTNTATIVGAKVLTLACSRPRADAVPEPCGRPTADSWEVRLSGERRTDRVMAQLDLG